MDRKRLTYFTFSFLILILLVVLLFARGTARRSDRITLPDPDSDSQGGSLQPDNGDSALNLVEITPETVQTAISVMSRPAAYSRTVTVELFWEEGSRAEDTAVYERGGVTRMDTQLSDGSTRHLLTDGETTCLWYNNSSDWTTFPAGAFSQDAEQRLPTYEDILEKAPRRSPMRTIAPMRGSTAFAWLRKRTPMGMSPPIGLRWTRAFWRRRRPIWERP